MSIVKQVVVLAIAQSEIAEKKLWKIVTVSNKTDS